MERGYLKTYNWVVTLLQDCDFVESSRRLGLRHGSPHKTVIDFLGRTYAIAKDGIELIEQKIAWTPDSEGYEYNLKSVLGYYLLSEADVEPENDFCTLTRFSHGVFRDEHVFRDSLSRVYGDDYKKFCKTAEELGMVFEAEKSSGHYKWSYTLLPKMPVKIIYYEGDDEYPTKLQILYDKTAIKIYKFEPLAVLHSCLVEGLASIGENKTAG